MDVGDMWPEVGGEATPLFIGILINIKGLETIVISMQMMPSSFQEKLIRQQNYNA